MTAADKNNIALYGVMVADHVPAMLAYWDKDLICRFANASYLQWFGKTREQMVGKITLKELLGPLFPLNEAYIKGALEGQIQTFERKITQPSGFTRDTIANYIPDFRDGKVVGFSVHVTDITPVKMQELERKNQIISEQNIRLVNFSNTISHNLKSYSRNLEMILKLFINAKDEETKSKMLHHLQIISNGFSSTMADLNKVIEAQNGGDEKLEKLNLHEYVEKAKHILGIEIEVSNAVFINNVNPNITLTANAAYLESILLNFCSNAIKYRSPERPLMLELSSRFQDNELELSIKDNGLGINLEKYGHDLFKMYKTFHRNPDAQGIGLFISKYQIEAMRGRITVESEVDKGTTFHLLFWLG